MRILTLSLPALTLAAASPALAASTTPVQSFSFVSSSGSDANDCSYNAPCQSLSVAIDTTYTGGTVTIQTPGSNFGTVFISRSMTIRGAMPDTALIAWIRIQGVNGGKVTLENLAFNGAISNTMSYSTAITIYQNPSADIILNNLKFQSFWFSGITSSSNGYARITITNSHFRQLDSGVIAQSGANSHFKIYDTNMVSNATAGINLEDGGSDVFIANSHIFGSPKGISLKNGATARSYGNNVITSGDAMASAPLN